MNQHIGKDRPTPKDEGEAKEESEAKTQKQETVEEGTQPRLNNNQ